MPPSTVLHPLINLRALHLRDDYGLGDTAHVDAALQALPQLTALQLSSMPRMPQAVSGLAQLQRCVWDSDWRRPSGQLPGGPWLSSLRKLMLRSRVVADNLGMRQATQLEHLALHAHEGEAAPAAEVLNFVCQHASLLCLQLCRAVGISEADAAVAMQGHARLRVLQIERLNELLHAVVPEFYTDRKDFFGFYK